MVVLLVPISFAWNTTTLVGSVLDNVGITTSARSIDGSLEELQSSNAEGETQVALNTQIYELKKKFILDEINLGWDIILAFFSLIRDAIVLIVYLIEMRLILIVIVELLPDLFIKIRDRICKWYLEKRRRA